MLVRAIGTAAALLVSAGARAAEPPLEPIVAGVVLNGISLADAQLMHREAAAIWIALEQAQAWRFATADRARRTIDGVAHARFCVARDRCSYDESSALLTMTLDARDLQALLLAPARPAAVATESTGSGAFVNYDLSLWRIGRPGASAVVEARVHSPYGHGALWAAAVVASGRRARIQAQGLWQIDDPQRGLSWQGGDITVPDTALAPGLPLRGVRVGSNARLRPLQSQVLRPSIEAVAERSLRADVFVDGLFRQGADVPYGPFSVQVQPHRPGRGEIELISTDTAGLRTRTRHAYYQAAQMLAVGAAEWSLDVGTLDRGIERASIGGAPAVVSVALRSGLSDRITAQVQGLAAQGGSRLALEAHHVAPRWGLTSASVLWQRTPARPSGRTWLGLGHEYLSDPWSLVFKAEQAGDDCTARPVASALDDRLRRPCRSVGLSLGANVGTQWSLAAALDAQREPARSARVATLSLRYQVSPRRQLALSMQQAAASNRGRLSSLQLVWSQPLGRGHQAQVGMRQRAGEGASAQWSVASGPADDGNRLPSGSFQAYGSVGQQHDIGARWAHRGRQQDWRAHVWADSRGVSGAASVAGALGVAAGRVFGTRRIDDAFVLVDVGLPDLPVLLDSREVARTNAAGWAVVTEARAHQSNMIGVDVSALPINYSLPRDQQAVVPSIGAGVLARFDVSDGGTSIAVHGPDGQRVPAGATVRVSTQRLATAVTSRSEVFIERSDRAAAIEIEWAGQVCTIAYRPGDPPEGGWRCGAR